LEKTFNKLTISSKSTNYKECGQMPTLQQEKPQTILKGDTKTK
jgi:hypothetical protein